MAKKFKTKLDVKYLKKKKRKNLTSYKIIRQNVCSQKYIDRQKSDFKMKFKVII